VFRVPPDLAEPLVLECFAEPFTNVDPYYLGRETVRCGSGRWSVVYELETGSGQSEGVHLPGLATLEIHPPGGGGERAVGRPGSTRSASVLTDGPSLGVLAVVLAGCEPGMEENYGMPTRDLRQGTDYDLVMRVGGWSDVGTAWGERRCLEVRVLPQNYTFQLDSDGWPWAVCWRGGFAERAVYGERRRRPPPAEEPLPEEEEPPTETTTEEITEGDL
jgi:hypothetical protein